MIKILHSFSSKSERNILGKAKAFSISCEIMKTLNGGYLLTEFYSYENTKKNK